VPNWHIPAEQVENRQRAHPAPVIASRRTARDRPKTQANRDVFAGRGGKGHIGAPHHTWDAVSRVAGLHLWPLDASTFTNVCLKLESRCGRWNCLTSHADHNNARAYTDTKDLREDLRGRDSALG